MSHIRNLLSSAALLLAATLPAAAQNVVKIGIITPLTGEFSSTGQEMKAAIDLFMAQHGDKVAGDKIELILRDDGAVPSITKRVAQEMVVNDHVSVLAGFGLTPLALAVAPIATTAKIPELVMGAATSTIPVASPNIVRTSFNVAAGITVIAKWAAANNIKTVVTMVTDYAPGIDTENTFRKTFEAAGGKLLGAVRMPVPTVDFAPYLQSAADLHPDALFIFVPAGRGTTLMRQFSERGLDKAGIKLIAAGDVLDDQLLDQIGDASLGLISAYHVSAAHPTDTSRDFVAAFMKANPNMRPNMMAVGAYDGMTLIYKALEKTHGNADGQALLAAMHGMAWESPRGPVEIDPNTGDLIQNIYLRKVEKRDGHLWNIEFQTYPMVKNPALAQ